MYKYILLVLITPCFLFAGELNREEWIPFKESNLPRNPEFAIIASTPSLISIKTDIAGVEWKEIDTDWMIDTKGEHFVLLTIPGHKWTGEIGKPKLPVIRTTVEVPYGAELKIEVVKSRFKDVNLKDFGIYNRIMPALESVLKIPGARPVFVIDEEYYSRDEFLPAKIAKIEKIDIMRRHRLAMIEIIPVQYNPVAGRIRYYSDIELRIDFIGGDVNRTIKTIDRDYSPVYEDFIKKRVLNYGVFESKGLVPLPIHYLIITHNDFQSQMDSMAYWLKKKGFKVKIANQDSISPWTSANIESYINAQVPQPTYLLLVGDVNGGYMPAPIGGASGKVTDLYYAETDGTGYLPDIFYGRLSCETTTHATTEVDKILKYQKGNIPTGWHKKAAFCAGIDNYTISEGTHNYCTSNFLDPNGYTTFKLYMQTYGATTADVTNNVNDGRALITMSGHGSDDGWHDGPLFTVTEVNALSNDDKLTIATGHCCLANNFGSSVNPCGGESWVRKVDGGAVAYYGACPLTYWDEDDWLQKEWYEAIYQDDIYEHARFTLDGMYDGVELSGSALKQYYYEGYHVLGDPSLQFWTEELDTLEVTHSATVPLGASIFTVTVKDNDGITAIDSALVCCMCKIDQTVHEVGYTNLSGEVTLNINPSQDGDTMWVTVTKHNYRPYESYALIVSEGPYVAHLKHTIDDVSGGNGDGFINPTETIDLPLWVKNWGSDTAFSVTGKLTTSDAYTTIIDSVKFFGTIAPDDSVEAPSPYEFSVDASCPDGHSISFTLICKDNLDSTWVSGFSETVRAPVLSYTDHTINDTGQTIPNGRLDPGETDSLIVTLKNSGSGDATNVSAELTTSDIYVTVVDGSATFGTILSSGTGNNSSNPYVISADVATPQGHRAILKLNMTADNEYAAMDSFKVVVGVKGEILVIDDDDGGKAEDKSKPGIGRTKAVGESADSIASYLEQLSYAVVKEAPGATDTSRWWDYDAIVWSDGADINPVANASYRSALINYVNGGGRLLIEGGEIAYDWDTEDPTFSQKVTHAIDWDGDNAGALNLLQSTHIIANDPNTLPNTIGISYTGYGDQDASKVTADATIIYDCGSYPGDAGVLAYDEDILGPDNGQIVFFAFNFVALSDQSVAKSLLENSIEYLLRATNYPPEDPALISLFDNEGTPSKTPSFEWNVPSDPEGSSLHFKIQWDEDANFGSPVTIESKISTAGFSPTPPVAEGTGSCSYTVSSQGEGELANDSTYWWRVTAWDGSNYGNWSEKRSFTVDTTLSHSIWFQTTGEQFQTCILSGVVIRGDSLVLLLNEVDTLLNEGFEGTFPPTGWNVERTGTSTHEWTQASDRVHSGSRSAKVEYDFSNEVETWLVTRELNLANTMGDTLIFWGQDDWASYYVYHGVWIGNTPDVAEMDELQQIFATAEDVWEESKINLGPWGDSATVYLAFKYKELDGTNWWIDDVIVKGLLDADSGTAKAPHIAYDDFSFATSWDSIIWHQVAGSDSIRIQVEYLGGGSWSLIPDAHLPSNSAGFVTTSTEGGIDISVLNTTTYDTLRIKATFIKKDTKSATEPSLKDWTVSATGAPGVEFPSFTTIGRIPKVYSLFQNYPNPFATTTIITYVLPLQNAKCKMQNTKCFLKIYDVSGRVIRTLVEGKQKPGYYRVKWDGKDGMGRRVPNGVYFYRLEIDKFKKTKQLVLIR